MDTHRPEFTAKFVALVVDMRRWQRKFFRSEPGSTQRREALVKSQEAERKVDRACANFKAPSLEL